MNASGSATRENQRVIESIQGRINLLNNDWQKLWVNTVESDFIKFWVDVADAAVRAVDALGTVPTILTLISGAMTMIKWDQFTERFTGLSSFFSNINSLKLYTGKGDIFASTFSSLGNTDKAKSFLDLTEQLTKAFSANTVAGNLQANQLKQQAIASGQYTNAQVNLISSIYDYISAQHTAKLATDQLAIAEKAGAALRKTLISVGVMAATYVITQLIKTYTDYRKELKESQKAEADQAKQRTEQFLETQNAIRRYRDAFKDVNANESDQEAATKAVVNVLGEKADALKDLEKGTEEYQRKLESLIKIEEQQYQQGLAQLELDAKIQQNNLDLQAKENGASYRAVLNTDPNSNLGGTYTTNTTIGRRYGLDQFDSRTAEGQVAIYYRLLEVRQELAEQNKIDTEDYNIINNLIESQKQNVLELTEALVDNEISRAGQLPQTAEEYDKLKEKILEEVDATEQSQVAYEQAIDARFDYLAKRRQAEDETIKLAQSRMRQLAGEGFNVLSTKEIKEQTEAQREFIESLSEDDLEAYNQILADESYHLNQLITDYQSLQNEINNYEKYKVTQIETEQGFVEVVRQQKDAIDNLQDSLASLSGMLADTFDGSINASDYLDYLQTIVEEIDKLGDGSKTKLENMFNNLEYGNLEQLNEIITTIAEDSAKELFNRFEDLNNLTLNDSIKNTIIQMIQMEGKLAGVTTGLSNLASAYNTLQGAIDQYNEDGVMTISTITSLMQLEPQYLALLSDENGLLTLNEQGLIAIAQQRIKDAQAVTEENAAMEINAILRGALARASENTKEAIYRQSKANMNLAASLEVVQGSAINTAQAYRIYQQTLDRADRISASGLLTDEEQNRINEIKSQTNRARALYKQMYDSITIGGKDVRDKIMGYSNSAAEDAEKKAEEAAQKIKSHIDDLLSHWKQAVDDGAITYRTYLQKLKEITDRYYKEGKLSAEDYADYQHQYLEGQVEMWKQVESAVQNYLTRQKDAIQEQIDALEDQKEAFEDNIELIEEYYETLLKPLNADKEGLEANREALEEERDAYQRMIDIIEKRYEKEIEANDKIIKGHEKNIKAIEKEMKPYQEQIELYEKQIKAYEREIDPYEKQIKALEKQIEPYEKQIKALEKVQKENEKTIKLLEKQKNPYEEQIKLLEKQREELEKANQAREDALRLQKAQYELERAQNQRVNNVYEGGQFIYKADDAAIKSAREELDNIAYEAQIKSIEDAIESLQGHIDTIQLKIEEIEKHNEILNEQIEKLNGQIDNFNEQIEALEEQIASINEEIDDLNDKIEELNYALEPFQERIDAINELIDELNEKNEELQDQQEAETEALYDTVEALDESIQAYDDQIKVIDKKIAQIEKQRDVEVEAIEEQIKVLDKETETLQKQIDKIDEYAKKWGEVVEQWERIKEEKLLSEIFGEGWQEKLNSLDPTILQTFADSYMTACRNLADYNYEVVNSLKDIEEEAKQAKAALNSVVDAADDAKKAQDRVAKYQGDHRDVPMVYGYGTPISTSGQIGKHYIYGGHTHSVGKYAKGGRVTLPVAAKGRRVTTGDLLTQLANKVGEDTMVAAKVGEGIFTKRQTDDLEEFIKLTPALIESTKGLEKYAKLVSMLDLSGVAKEMTDSAIKTQAQIQSAVENISGNMKRMQSIAPNEKAIALSIGDIHIAHTDDVNGLAKQIKANFPNAMLQLLSS